MHPTVLQVTQRIAQRSAAPRRAYLERVERLASRPRGSDRLGCANVAHAFAALPGDQRLRIVAERAPNLAHRHRLQRHAVGAPAVRALSGVDPRRGARARRHRAGGRRRAGDVRRRHAGPARHGAAACSRATAIAMGTAIALSHDVFDGALLLGVCDKIVPGLLIGALHFGHLPCVFVPAGPMASGLSNSDKSKVREQHAQGLVGRDALLQAEQAAYHGAGHLHVLRHRQQQPDAARGDGPARAGHGVRAPEHGDARGAHARGGAHAAGHRAGAAAPADRPPGRRARDRQRDGRAAGHRRLDQPPDPLGRGGARGRPDDRLDRLRRAVVGGAAAGARVSQRQRRRQSVPGRRRHRLRAARAGAGRPLACRRAHRRHARHGRLRPRARAGARALAVARLARRQRRHDDPARAPTIRSRPPAACACSAATSAAR